MSSGVMMGHRAITYVDSPRSQDDESISRMSEIIYMGKLAGHVLNAIDDHDFGVRHPFKGAAIVAAQRLYHHWAASIAQPLDFFEMVSVPAAVSPFTGSISMWDEGPTAAHREKLHERYEAVAESLDALHAENFADADLARVRDEFVGISRLAARLSRAEAERSIHHSPWFEN